MTASDPLSLEFIQLRIVNHVGWVEFNRPPINAFTKEMLTNLCLALEYVGASAEVRVVVIGSANERYFSAGADLAGFANVGEQGMASFVDIVHRVVGLIRASQKPMLAAIAGTAVGGGLEATLHCDYRFAASNARFGQPEVTINFIPPVGATQALARLLGRTRAIKYLYDGAIISAAEALELGVVDQLVEEANLESTVQAYAETLCAKPPEALAAIRRAITEGGSVSFDDGLRIERELAISLAGTANFDEGIDAFLNKRDPKWSR